MAKPHYEFGGPFLGPLGIVVGAPLLCYLLVYSCNEQVGTGRSYEMSCTKMPTELDNDAMIRDA